MPTTTDRLFSRYLDALNRGLEVRSEAYPFRQIRILAARVLTDRDLAVAVRRRDGPDERFTIRFKEGAFNLVHQDARDAELAWSVDERYLERLPADPDEILRRPRELDLSWLERRLGIGAPPPGTPGGP